MAMPRGLGDRGKALWRSTMAGLPKGWELDERETQILTLAVRQADDLRRLEIAIRRDGAMVPGSQGQPVLNPAIGEARLARLAITRLLGELKLPDAAGVPRSSRSRSAQRAAAARWGT